MFYNDPLIQSSERYLSPLPRYSGGEGKGEGGALPFAKHIQPDDTPTCPC